MRKLLKFRNLKKLDCATVRKNHVTSVTSCATIHNAAFSACQTPAFIRETEGSMKQNSGEKSSDNSSENSRVNREVSQCSSVSV
jgi:hypothetical protein